MHNAAHGSFPFEHGARRCFGGSGAEAAAGQSIAAGCSLRVIGKNLTNKFYFIGAGTAPLTGAGTGTNAATLGDIIGYGAMPRTVRMQITVRY